MNKLIQNNKSERHTECESVTKSRCSKGCTRGIKILRTIESSPGKVLTICISGRITFSWLQRNNLETINSFRRILVLLLKEFFFFLF